ncbi:MAG TPA: ShlB/FhaC/HecB family hemolysin secretion/activation protein [Opitutaceae bacterium]
MTIFGAARAQTYDQVAPRPVASSSPVPTLQSPPPAPVAGDPSTVLIPQLRGLVFVPSRTAVRREGVSGTGVRIEGLDLLDDDAFRAAMRRYLDRPLTRGDLNELTRDVVLYCRQRNRPIVDVLVPEQDANSGTIQVLVIEGRLGRVSVEGNQYFTAEQLTGAIRSQPGQVLENDRMLEDIIWINQNPFRQVDLVFTRGASTGETDIILRVKDRRPVRLYFGYDDSGNALTGFDRVQAGVNLGNLFHRDQVANYQLTASPDFERMLAHSASYSVPLPRWRHTLTVFGSFAESRPQMPSDFDLKGATWQASARYRIPLNKSRDVSHDVTIGVDFKRSNNDLAFGGYQVFAQSTDIVQFSASYGLSWSRPGRTLAVSATLVASPGGLSGANRDRDFAATRSGADAEYGYARLEAEHQAQLPLGLSWTIRATGQFATANLLGSEQLGLGGSQGLRGYEEREGNGDNGFMVVNELHLPAQRIAGRLLRNGVFDRLDTFGFVDYGWLANHDRLPGEIRRIEMASLGAGLRYAVGSNISLRFDYGWQLEESGVSDGRRSSRGHFSVNVSY